MPSESLQLNLKPDRPSGRMRRIIGLAVAGTLFCTMLTGCWDRLEIEERGLVLGIGVDVASKEDLAKESEVSHLKGSFPIPSGNGVKVTAQIAIPGRIPLGPGDSGGGTSGAKPVWVLTSVGHTVEDALNNLQQELADRMFYGHLRVIVLSEAYAKMGMEDVNDFLRRTPEVRRTTWMVVCDEKAESVMRMAPQLERVPSLYLLATMDQAVRMGKLPNAFVGTFWTAQSAKGMDAFLPYVKLVHNENMQISGLALFSGTKLSGVTRPLEIGAYMAIKAINPGGYSLLMELPDMDTVITYQITHRNSHTRLTIRDGVPEFRIRVSNEGNLKDKTNEMMRLNAEQIATIETELNKVGKKSLENFIKKTQEMDSDIFGFGEYVRAKEPRYWNEHVKSGEGWSEMYKRSVFQVEVDYRIRRIGSKAT